MSLLHSSTRRPAALQDADYDHEIGLVDHTKAVPSNTSRSASPNDSRLTQEISDSSSRRHSDVPLRKSATPQRLRKQITKRKYAKYQKRTGANTEDDDLPSDSAEGGNESSRLEEQSEPNGQVENEDSRGRSTAPRCSKGPKGHKEPESAIDVLYENERGGFFCGIALFASKALGNLDPSPWTNIAHKTSATNITNAQVPDPSWEWAWKEWKINRENDVDQDGWEYSFAFSKKFSWHGPKWWNSFVRRRAWIRKRVKKHSGYLANNPHMMNPDYFTIHSARERSRSRGSSVPASEQRMSYYSRHEAEEPIAPEDISDIGALMKVLRLSRIDRERTEAVESFIEHGGDDLSYLRERMHDIMGMFIFQASRRLLLTHLLRIFDEAAGKQKEYKESGKEIDPVLKKRYDNLEAAIHHADEEVKRLEFWSDVKDMAEKGETKGAVDKAQGWVDRWVGLDGSGAKDVWSHKVAGMDDCDEHEGNGTAKGQKFDNGKENEMA